MKKTAAILLALTFALASAGALADTLTVQPGTPINATPDIFQSVFGIIAGSSRLFFTWEEAPAAEEGYEVYTAHAGDVDLDVKLYVSDGFVSYAACQIKEYKISNANDAYTIGKWVGSSIASIAYTVYLADSGDMSGDRAEELNDAAQQIVQFMAECLGDAQKLQDGAVMTFTVLDHPAGCEISGVATPQEGTLNIRIVVAGQDGVLGSAQ